MYALIFFYLCYINGWYCFDWSLYIFRGSGSSSTLICVLLTEIFFTFNKHKVPHLALFHLDQYSYCQKYPFIAANQERLNHIIYTTGFFLLLDTINSRRTIVYIEGSQVLISTFLWRLFLSSQTLLKCRRMRQLIFVFTVWHNTHLGVTSIQRIEKKVVEQWILILCRTLVNSA